MDLCTPERAAEFCKRCKERGDVNEFCGAVCLLAVLPEGHYVDIDVDSLAKLAGVDPRLVAMALGWMLRCKKGVRRALYYRLCSVAMEWIARAWWCEEYKP